MAPQATDPEFILAVLRAYYREGEVSVVPKPNVYAVDVRCPDGTFEVSMLEVRRAASRDGLARLFAAKVRNLQLQSAEVAARRRIVQRLVTSSVVRSSSSMVIPTTTQSGTISYVGTITTNPWEMVQAAQTALDAEGEILTRELIGAILEDTNKKVEQMKPKPTGRAISIRKDDDK
ncbi:MAG TPA: hypothetical protein DGH68_05295 [Bacteroidetes bacterium]|nr:hypothetical protein [Bacteroidota bacterium]